MVTKIILGPGDPEDASLVQLEETFKVDVSLVEDGDLSVLKPSTEGQSACAVMMGSLLMMAKAGRKLCRFSLRCIFAAALRRRCLAQSIQLATRAMVEESTA